MTITATVVSQPITAAVSGGGNIAANVGSSTVSAAASGGIGPQGPAGEAVQSDFDGDRSSSRYDIYPRGFTATGLGPGTRVILSFFSVSASITVSSLVSATNPSGTAAFDISVARMGLYEFDGTTVTLIARTANDATLFTALATAYTRSLSTDAGYPATVTLVPGARYAFAIFCNPARSVAFVGRGVNPILAAQEPRMSALLEAGLTDLPESSSTFTNTGIQVYGGLVVE